MIRSDNPPDNGVSGAMYLFGTALLWSFIGILVRANSQSALLIGAVTAIFMALFILLVGRPVFRVSRLIVLVAVCNFVTGTTFNYSNIAYTAGPLLGGAIVSCFATQSVYLLMAGMMGVAAVLSLGCHECVAPAKGEKPKGGILGGMAEGARLTFRDHDLRLIFISGFLGFFAFGAFDSLESLFYRDVLNVDIVWLGWLSSVVGLTSSVGAFILTKLSARHVNLRLLLGALMAVGIGSMVYVGTDMLGVAIIGQAINGLAWGFLEPLQMILIQERADIKYLGRITGFVRFGLMSAGVLPLLAAPFLAEALGVQTVLFGASTIIALVGTLFFVTQGRCRGR